MPSHQLSVTYGPHIDSNVKVIFFLKSLEANAQPVTHHSGSRASRHYETGFGGDGGGGDGGSGDERGGVGGGGGDPVVLGSGGAGAARHAARSPFTRYELALTEAWT